jgi:TM2 domain-containing membrane protein YozV
MSTSLIKSSRSRGGGSGIIPAVCSAIIPGVGQLVNGETDKAIGVFVVAAGAMAGVHLPLIGGIVGLIGVGTWLYGVADGFIQGRKKR